MDVSVQNWSGRGLLTASDVFLRLSCNRNRERRSARALCLHSRRVLTLGLSRAQSLARVHVRACVFTMPVLFFFLLLLVLHPFSCQEVAPDANFPPPSQLQSQHR